VDIRSEVTHRRLLATGAPVAKHRAVTLSWRVIPGPPPTPPNGNLADIVAAGGLHTFQLDLHERYGPVARFELSGTRVVSVADPDLLAVTSRINRRPEGVHDREVDEPGIVKLLGVERDEGVVGCGVALVGGGVS
jgi:hypothetical protein